MGENKANTSKNYAPGHPEKEDVESADEIRKRNRLIALSKVDQEAMETTLADSATRAWLANKGKKLNVGDEEAIHSILDDPETREWLARKAKHCKAGSKEIIQDILDNPETEQWIRAKKGKNKDADTLGFILEDPETINWISKNSKRDKVISQDAVGIFFDGLADQKERTDSHPVLRYLEEPQDCERTLLVAEAPATMEAAEAAPAPGSLARQQRLAARNQPGAYSASAGGIQRTHNVQFSHVGIQPNVEARAQEGQEELAEAMPVQDVTVPDMEAQPVDLGAMERRHSQAKQQQRRLVFGLTLFLLGTILAATIRVVLGNREKGVGAAILPTSAPSAVQSEYPSYAPSGVFSILMDSLSSTTLESLKSISTPQWKALDWLENHPELPGMAEWRRKQLFALATFFFAMGGEAWPEVVKDRWLQYDRQECLWFSSKFGGLWEGQYEETEYYPDFGIEDPCNSTQGKFLTLFLANFDLSNQNVLVPPETALLTSLTTFSLAGNGINASILDFLPSAFYQLANLTFLNFNQNHLTGSISSEFGQMVGMVHFSFHQNWLSGPLPSELGLMTSMSWLDLTWNTLTGPLPSELGLMTNTTLLNLGDNSLSGMIPSEVGLMTSMTTLFLTGNCFTGFIPSELGQMSASTGLFLSNNILSGLVPTELGLMTGMSWLHLGNNSLMGQLPSELGLMTGMTGLVLQHNELNGQLPSTLGQMTSMTWLHLGTNNLNGSLPSEVGQMTSMRGLFLNDNSLTGLLPSELGLMTSARRLNLFSNSLAGPVPSELALMTSLKLLRLENNTLTGAIPGELEVLATNGSLVLLKMANNSLSGTIPENLCSLGMFDQSLKTGLSFDCSDLLCGCCWCPCPGSNSSDECQTSPLDLEWPGEFPSTPHAITINIRTDDYPEENSLEWSIQDSSGLWQLLDTHSPPNKNTVHSYLQWVDADALYRLQIFDKYADGTCCRFGMGWFTITSSASSRAHTEGSIVWKANGDALQSSLDVFIWIDSNGNAKEVAEGQGVIQDDSIDRHNLTLPPSSIPSTAMENSTNEHDAAVGPGMG